jgi:periplasmic protein TonB
MSTALLPGAARQSLILAAISALHVAAFILVGNGLAAFAPLPRVLTTPITVPTAAPPPAAPVRPETVRAVDFEPLTVPEPPLEIPFITDAPSLPAPGPEAAPGTSQAVAAVPAAGDRAPGLQTRDWRMASLVDACYPSASRRLGEAGRVVARIVVGADGRPVSWVVAQGSGIPRLDAAAGCVIRRLAFTAGVHGGQPVEAAALLPIHFRISH